MSKLDRLTTLIERFPPRVIPDPHAPSMGIMARDGTAVRVVCDPEGELRPAPGETIAFALRVEWGGPAHPLAQAMPGGFSLDLDSDPQTRALVDLLLAEAQGRRCGSVPVLRRLGEVLVVRLLRARIEAGAATPGLLAGLADARLARAIVAIHKAPGHAWRTEDLAREAGLSASRFSELFHKAVGESPTAYLRRWRLALARQDLARGDRVETVAHRYGYASPEGFTRAFRKDQGVAPLEVRMGRADKDRIIIAPPQP